MPARQAHGQDARHRRDRRRPARARHGRDVRQARPAVPGLHGRGGHAPAEAQRVLDGAVRRRGGAGGQRLAHLEGRRQRGAARLGRFVCRHLLRDRLGARPVALSGHGARVPDRGGPRGGEPVPGGGHRAGRADRLRRRRLQLPGHVCPAPGGGAPGADRRGGGRPAPGAGPARLAHERPRRAGDRARLQVAVPDHRRRADLGHPLGVRRARLPRRGSAARRARAHRAGAVHHRLRRRGAGCGAAVRPQRGHRDGPGVGACRRGGAGRGAPPAPGSAPGGEHVGPRRQGSVHPGARARSGALARVPGAGGRLAGASGGSGGAFRGCRRDATAPAEAAQATS